MFVVYEIRNFNNVFIAVVLFDAYCSIRLTDCLAHTFDTISCVFPKEDSMLAYFTDFLPSDVQNETSMNPRATNSPYTEPSSFFRRVRVSRGSERNVIVRVRRFFRIKYGLVDIVSVPPPSLSLALSADPGGGYPIPYER